LGRVALVMHGRYDPKRERGVSDVEWLFARAKYGPRGDTAGTARGRFRRFTAYDATPFLLAIPGSDQAAAPSIWRADYLGANRPKPVTRSKAKSSQLILRDLPSPPAC
jgi:hypothetical protein